MRFQFAIVMLAMLAMVANSSRHQLQNPPAYSPSPSPSPSCSSVVYEMVDCISFLVIGSKDKKVAASCCSGFASVVEIDPNCICEGLKTAMSIGYNINMTRAMDLPHKCKVTVSPTAQSCNVSPTPSAGPAGPPDSSSPEFPPTTEPSTSPSIEPPAPSTNPGGSPSISAPSPSKGGAYSVSISFFGLISLLLGSLLV